FCIGPKGSLLVDRRAPQMSFLPSPPARVEAMYSCLPSGDSMGQPSWASVFTSATAVGARQGPKSDAMAATEHTLPDTRRLAPAMDVMARRVREWAQRPGAAKYGVIFLLHLLPGGTVPAT